MELFSRVKQQHRKVKQVRSKIMWAMAGKGNKGRQQRGNTGAMEHDNSSDRPALLWWSEAPLATHWSGKGHSCSPSAMQSPRNHVLGKGLGEKCKENIQVWRRGKLVRQNAHRQTCRWGSSNQQQSLWKKTYGNSWAIAACTPLYQNYLKIVIEGHKGCNNPKQRGDTLEWPPQHWNLRATQHTSLTCKMWPKYVLYATQYL